LNEFLGEVNKNGGRVVKLENVVINYLSSTKIETELYSGEYLSGIESNNQDKFIVHYRCYEKINYFTQQEKELFKITEEQKIKYLKRQSKFHVKKLKKEFFDSLQIKQEQKEIEERNKYDNFFKKYERPDTDDLPF
jgi:tRNA(Phe) wybutosine-synthesizing methylase Tyw3